MSKMAGGVGSLMEDTEHLDHIILDSIVENMALDGENAATGKEARGPGVEHDVYQVRPRVGR